MDTVSWTTPEVIKDKEEEEEKGFWRRIVSLNLHYSSQ